MKVLLFIETVENRRLLQEWLGRRHEVIVGEAVESLQQPCDLIVLDGPWLSRLAEDLQARKAAERPVLLPVLLVTARKDVKLITRGLWRVVDELIITPIERLELRARVEVLLRARALSLELRRTVEELNEQRRLYLTFVSSVAHDLKNLLTPLLSVEGWLRRIESLRREQRERLFSTLVDVARRMDRLVDDLMDVSRIETGQFSVQRRAADLVGIARSVVEMEQARTEKHRIVLEGPEHLEGMWDPDRLAQAITNLVSNAIKYSPEGGTVRVRIREDDGRAEVCVTDQGIGFRREDLPRLFKPYARLDHRRRVPGVGLGLYITKAIVEAHGGRIWATSPGPSQGSTFCFLVPR